MLDAIAQVDNLGMEDSTLAADASTTGLETNTALGESQGSSIQSADFDQSLTDMLSGFNTPADVTNPSLQIVSGQSIEDALADAIPGLDPTTVTPPAPLAPEVSPSNSDAPADVVNPSLQIVSGQSVEDALADAIPGLDPTTVTPPAPLAQDSSLNIAGDSSSNPFMMAAISELDNPESIGEAFQTVSDGFEGLSNSFEQLAASFLTQNSNFNPAAIDANGGNVNTAPEMKNAAIGDGGNDADIKLDTNLVAIKNINGDDSNSSSHSSSHIHSDVSSSDSSGYNPDKMAIAGTTDDSNVNDFGISNLTRNNDNVALGTNFNLDFDALKLNVKQVSRGLQFLVQQLETAFERDDSALTTPSTLTSLR